MRQELNWNSEIPIIASKVREARRYVGCKVEEAANFLGISKDEYSDIEKRQTIVSKHSLEKLSKLYYRPVQYFIKNAQNPVLKYDKIGTDKSMLSKQDKIELRKFSEFLITVPRKQLKNGGRFNFQKILAHSKNRQNSAKSAVELSQRLQLNADYSKNFQVDVFAAIKKMGLLLLFRPMGDLFGASVKIGDRIGIVVNSGLPLDSQRHIAACELGRHVLGTDSNWQSKQLFIHTQSVKKCEISDTSREMMEIQEFASNFLLPEELFHALMEKQGWEKNSMVDPEKIYQASLRFGTSFNTTVHGFEREKYISKTIRNKLAKCNINDLKHSLLDNRISASALTVANVWHLTEKDNGLVINAGPHDILLFDFFDSPTTGYVWNFNELDRKDFTILHDHSTPFSPANVGSAGRRRVIVKANKQSMLRDLQLQRKRPWKGGGSLEPLNFHYHCNPN